MADREWKVTAVETFRGEKYIKLERLDIENASPFSKKHANVSESQMRAILGHMGVLELEEFAGMQAT